MDFRDYKVIDDLCLELRYFKRQAPNIRRLLFENCRMVEFEPNAVVYKQGDPGDFMCIILKGKVRLEKRHQFYKDI